jgi:hypothetical protein
LKPVYGVTAPGGLHLPRELKKQTESDFVVTVLLKVENYAGYTPGILPLKPVAGFEICRIIFRCNKHENVGLS